MKILNYSTIDLSQEIKRSEQDVNNVVGTVNQILEDIKLNVGILSPGFKVAMTALIMASVPPQVIHSSVSGL